jgi:cystatin-A/B
MMCGGFGSAKQADETCTEVANSVKGKVENHLGLTFNTWEPVSYKTQVVAGTNYLVKVKVDDEKYVHVKVHKPLPHAGTDLQVMEATTGHSLETDL